jgi:hypothetical protein
MAAGGYAALSLMANRSAFFPMKYPSGWWDTQTQLKAEDVWLTTPDKVRIHAWWVSAEGARLATLFLHGNAGNVTHRADVLEALPAAGSAVLMLDYRGYGKSEGWPTEKGLYKDAEAAYAHLISRGHDPSNIVIHGESLGSAVAVDLASRLECRLLILEAPFPSARAVAGRVLPLLGPALVFGFDAGRKIGNVRAPILIIHGDRDEVIDFDLGKDLFAAAPEPKKFWQAQGAGHNNLRQALGAEYGRRLSEVYRKGL